MILANRLYLPDHTRAILWDMDGVLIDSLQLANSACNQLLAEYFGDEVFVEKSDIRAIFALHIAEYCRRILIEVEQKFGKTDALRYLATFREQYEFLRREYQFQLNPGILAILKEAKTNQLQLAVISNNPLVAVNDILESVQLKDYFDLIVGNDLQGLQKKPAPDTYLYAVAQLQLLSSQCVVVEDSLLGAEAGARAGCFTIGIATGANTFAELEQATWTNQVYSQFQPIELQLQFGNVQKKRISTPNDFVSHMVEHIAWRLGLEIDLLWHNNDWQALGKILGSQIAMYPQKTQQAVALGMIDDGSAEVQISIGVEQANYSLESIQNTDLTWFLSCRCEQLSSGQPLLELISGLVEGLHAVMKICICSVQDPHHTWEGVFRSIGIALSCIYTPTKEPPTIVLPKVPKETVDTEIQIFEKSADHCKVFRGTAESHVMIQVDFSGKTVNQFAFHVSSSIDVSRFPELLNLLSQKAGFSLQVEYNATVLNSSHVVLEDTALVLGRALREILVLRMIYWGVNGAGSSISSAADFAQQPIRIGLSIEGRKFWIFVPFQDSYEVLKKNFLIGQNVCDTLRSEDLDDFLDGLSGGLGCSILIHIQELMEADTGWRLIFANLGLSLKEAFAINPYRRGVPPGVKATLS